MDYSNLDNANYPSISNIEVHLIELDLDSDPSLTASWPCSGNIYFFAQPLFLHL